MLEPNHATFMLIELWNFSRWAGSSRSRTRIATRIGWKASTRTTPWLPTRRCASCNRATGTTKGVTFTPATVLSLETSWPSKRVKTETSWMLFSDCRVGTSTWKIPLIAALSRAWLSTGSCRVIPGPATICASARAASSSCRSPASMRTTCNSSIPLAATTGQSLRERIRPLCSSGRCWPLGPISVCARTAPSIASAVSAVPRSASAFTRWSWPWTRPDRSSGRPAFRDERQSSRPGSPAPFLQRFGRRGRGRWVRAPVRDPSD